MVSRLYTDPMNICHVLGGRELSGDSNFEETGKRIALVHPIRILSFAGLMAIAFAIVLASLPASRGAGIVPPNLELTFTGVQLEDRISYSLDLHNVGQL